MILQGGSEAATVIIYIVPAAAIAEIAVLLLSFYATRQQDAQTRLRVGAGVRARNNSPDAKSKSHPTHI